MAEQKMSNKVVTPAHTFDRSDVLRKSYAYFNGVENRFGFTWKRYSFSSGNNTVAMLRNLTNNLVAVVEKFLIVMAGAGGPTIYFGPGQSIAAANIASNVTRLDGRIGNSPSGLEASFGAGLVVNPTMLSIATLTGLGTNPLDFVNTVDQEITLTPGDSIIFTSGPASVTFHWRERLLEESEKSGNYGRLI
jgi:hypothetical protein